MRLLELLVLSLVASVVFAVTATAAIPESHPVVVQLGPAALSSSSPAERPQVIALPLRPLPAVAAPPAQRRAPQHTTAPRRITRVAVSRHVAPAPVVRSVPTGTVATDGYPYRTSQTNDHDAWGFTQRQCVSYAAWRLAEAGHAIWNDRDGWGSASGWDDTARRLGVRVDARATVGSIAQWNPGESGAVWAGTAKGTFTAGGYGHVGYVTRVYPDGSVQVAQYNVTGDRSYSSMRMTAPRFLHL